MENLGQQFYRQAMIAKKHSDFLYTKISKDIKRLNKTFHKFAIESYDLLVDRLDARGASIESSMDNLEMLSIWMPSFDLLLNRYRLQYRNTYEVNRVSLYETIKDKELRLMKVLAKMDVKDDRVTISDETLAIMNEIFNNMYRNIESMLIKWRGYVYDNFFQGITQGFTKDGLREHFINSTGTLRIGSSLEETSELQASMAAVAAKTAFLRAQAEINGYRHCWNVNPMDNLTKYICMEASLAGVITEDAMFNNFEWPPRFVCRCEIAFTRGEWVELNQAINGELRTARERVIQELINAPRQMAEYYVGGRLVTPRDPVRAAGLKMYFETERKLHMVQNTEVPDFIYDEDDD